MHISVHIGKKYHRGLNSLHAFWLNVATAVNSHAAVEHIVFMIFNT